MTAASMHKSEQCGGAPSMLHRDNRSRAICRGTHAIGACERHQTYADNDVGIEPDLYTDKRTQQIECRNRKPVDPRNRGGCQTV